MTGERASNQARATWDGVAFNWVRHATYRTARACQLPAANGNQGMKPIFLLFAVFKNVFVPAVGDAITVLDADNGTTV